MSDTSPNIPSPPELTKTSQERVLNKIRAWGTVAVSIFAMTTFSFALIWSFLTNDEGMKNLTGGASVALATTAVNWWLGSSKGSERKDDIIAGTPSASPPALVVDNTARPA